MNDAPRKASNANTLQSRNSKPILPRRLQHETHAARIHNKPRHRRLPPGINRTMDMERKADPLINAPAHSPIHSTHIRYTLGTTRDRYRTCFRPPSIKATPRLERRTLVKPNLLHITMPLPRSNPLSLHRPRNIRPKDLICGPIRLPHEATPTKASICLNRGQKMCHIAPTCRYFIARTLVMLILLYRLCVCPPGPCYCGAKR